MEIITRKVKCTVLKNISLISLVIVALLFFTYSTPKNEDGYIERIYIVNNKTKNYIDNATLYNQIKDTVISLIDTNNSDNFNEYGYKADYEDYDVENKTVDEIIDDYEINEKISTVQSTIKSDIIISTSSPSVSSIIINKDTKKPSTQNKITENPSTQNKETENSSTQIKDTEKPTTLHKDTGKPSTMNKDTEKPSTLNKDTKKPYTLNKDTEKPSNLNKDTKKPYTQNQVSTEKNLSKQELDAIWLKKMEERFERRRSRLKDGCQKLKSDLHYSTKRTLLNNIYMATKYDLLVCAVAKAGSSTWKTHLLTLNGYTNSGNVHANTNEKRIRAASRISLSAVSKRMHDNAYTRVMNARHPLDRLVSAYRDKYNDGGVVSDGKFKKEAANHLYKSGKDLKRISFEDFLKIVIRDQWAGLENAHWRNYYRTCSPCQLTYDYIMKVETYSEDLSYIFRKIGVTEINPELRKHGIGPISDRAKYENYYEDIPDDLLRKIHQLYKEDYELFGYDVPRFVKRSL